MRRIYDPEISQPFIAAFLQNAPSAIAMFDENMNYMMATHRWLTDYRLEGQVLLGRNHYDVFPEIPERWRAMHRRTLAGETLSAEADAFPRADGTVDYVRWRNVPWRREDGSIGGMVMFTENVTEQVRAEEEARRKTEWLELTQEIAKIGHWFVDLTAGELFWSDQVFRIHGVEPGVYTPELDTAVGFYHPEDRFQVQEAIGRAVANAEAFAFELRLVRPDGEVRWVSSKGECRVNEETGEVVALFGVIQDVTGRRQRETALRDTKERYDQAIQSADIGIWELDLETGEHSWSPLIKRILGMRPDAAEFTASDFEARVHPEDRREVISGLMRLGGEIGSGAVDFRLRKDSGDYASIRIRADAVRNESGVAERIAGSFSDVSEELQAEALRENLWDVLTEQGLETEDKLQRVLEQATDYWGMRFGIISRIKGEDYEVRHVCAPDGEISPGDTFQTRNTYCTHVLRADGPRAFHHVAESEIQNHPCYITFGLESYIGAPIMVEGERYGTVNFSSPLARDAAFTKADLHMIELIAQWVGYEIGRENNIASLRESEERFALAATGSSVGIWDWSDMKDDAQIWSDQYYRLLGYKPGEIEASVTNLDTKLIHPDDRDRAFAALERHLKDRQSFRVEFRLKHKDGEYLWFLGSGQALWDKNGEPRRMIGSIMDIHDRKTAERLKTEFVSTVSHELRTPMTSIMGALGLIRSGAFGEMPPKVMNLLTVATNNGDRLVRLISDILDVEKIEAGRIEMQRRDICVGDLLNDAVAQNAAFVSDNNAEISFTDKTGGAEISADSDRIMQVVTNLISNAAKFTGPQGLIEITARRKGGNIEIAVADNGPGIPESHIDSIFNKFVQVDSGDSRANEGTGLGLSISRAIVEAHGGQIRVESPPGLGAVFVVVLAEAGVDTAIAPAEQPEMLRAV